MKESSSDQNEQDRHKGTADEAPYRHLFEHAREGITVTTPGGDIQEVNPAAADILGYSRSELRSMNAIELYAEPDERKAATEELREEGTLVDWELRLQRSSGQRIVCAVSATLRQGGSEGQPSTYQTFFQDITEHKQAEKALAETEEMLRELSDHTLVGISLFQNGSCEYVNPELSEITGYSQEELLHDSPRLFVHPEDWPKVRTCLKKCLDGETQEVHYEARFQSKSGDTRHVEVAGSRITYEEEPAVLQSIQDVTEERRLQREILQVQEEERRRLGQNLHDGVAAQLTGVSMKLSILHRKSEEQCPDLSSRIQRVLELVEESNEDLRRISRGLNPVVLQDAGLLPALKRLADNTSACRMESSELPDDSELLSESFSRNEETHLYWIAQEAVANARRHADAEEIVLRLRRDGQGLVLEVVDDGTGFELSEIGKSKPTSKASSKTGLTEGLGLRTMRYRAELLGAQLQLESTPGDGTRVCCRLPE